MSQKVAVDYHCLLFLPLASRLAIPPGEEEICLTCRRLSRKPFEMPTDLVRRSCKEAHMQGDLLSCVPSTDATMQGSRSHVCDFNDVVFFLLFPPVLILLRV